MGHSKKGPGVGYQHSQPSTHPNTGTKEKYFLLTDKHPPYPSEYPNRNGSAYWASCSSRYIKLQEGQVFSVEFSTFRIQWMTGICYLRHRWQFLCSHNCETRILFSHNVPKSHSCPRPLSFDRCRKYWLTSQASVLRLSQLLMTHVPDVCPPTVTENKYRHLSATSKTRIAIMSSLSY